MNHSSFLQLLKDELIVALGCTEPIAIAYAAALARKYSQSDDITKIQVFASPNVIKNAMAVSIPGTNACGIDLAAALGSLSINADKHLEVLTGLTQGDIEKAKLMIRNGTINISIADSPKKLYIEVVLDTPMSNSRVVIEDSHTNVVLIEVDGISKKLANSSSSNHHNIQNIDFVNIDSIWEFITNVDIDLLDIVKESIQLNKKIGLEGFNNSYGLQVGKTIKLQIEKGLLADDLANNSMALTAAASDARMSGCELPVMSNSGSGNQGISATLPVVAVAKKLNIDNDEKIRAVALSHLVTIYIKSKFGRLSALCGAAISATGASCGICYLMKGQKNEIKSAIQNMLGNVTGILCDGAKPGCALKVATCTNAAVISALISNQGITIKSTDGIIENDPEDTIDNLCKLGNQGTIEADKIILEIMLKKSYC